MKIKVCGLKFPDNIAAVAALKPDLMGFINYSRSPRFIGDLPAGILINMPAGIEKTGVFVNETTENIERMIEHFGFNAIQLHGDESPEFCGKFDKVKVIKAIGVNDTFDFGTLKAYDKKVDYFLLDTKTEVYGGSGKVFDWDILDNYHSEVPFFIAGGLSIENLQQVKQIKHPMFFGVDLNSRFEAEPGFKDIQLLSQAFNILRGQSI